MPYDPNSPPNPLPPLNDGYPDDWHVPPSAQDDSFPDDWYVPPSAQLAGGTTPRSDVGTVRWVLITVIIIGGAGVLFGTLLRSGRLPRWRRGART